MEINIDSYLERYSQENKGYNKNDLKSNQQALARALQYIYVCGGNAENRKFVDTVRDVLFYNCDIIPVRVPKYRRESFLDVMPEQIKNKIVFIDNEVKISKDERQTFGEQEYIDYVESVLKSDDSKNFYYSTVKAYHNAEEYEELKQKYGIKNLFEIEKALKQYKGEK